MKICEERRVAAYISASTLSAALVIALGGCASSAPPPAASGQSHAAAGDAIPFVLSGFLRPDPHQAALAAHYYCSTRGSVAEYVGTASESYGMVVYFRCRKPLDGEG